MRYESTYFNKKLHKGHEKYQLTMAAGLAAVSFGFIASFYSDSSGRGVSRRGRLINRAIDGFQNMTITELLIAGLVASIVGFLVLFILDQKFGKRPIIVAYELDEENKNLRLETKILGRQKVQSNEYKLSEIAFSNRKLSDGIMKDQFNCIVFKKDFQAIGVAFLNHPMWMGYKAEEIEKSFEKIKLLTTSGMPHSGSLPN